MLHFLNLPSNLFFKFENFHRGMNLNCTNILYSDFLFTTQVVVTCSPGGNIP